MTNSLVSAGSVATAVGDVTVDYGASPSGSAHLLLAWANSNNSGGSFNITHNGSGWTLISSFGSGFNWNGVWYKFAAQEGEATQVTFTDSGNTVTAGLSIFTGPTEGLDKSGAAYATVPVVASGADTTGSCLVLGYFAWNGANANPTFSQTIDGSNGTALSLATVQGNSGAASAPFYIFSYGTNDSSPGSDANSLTGSISESEGYVAGLVASFK